MIDDSGTVSLSPTDEDLAEALHILGGLSPALLHREAWYTLIAESDRRLQKAERGTIQLTLGVFENLPLAVRELLKGD
jgi:hypothetical protein